MKRFIISAMLLFSMSGAYADQVADDAVRGVLSKIESYNPYRVEIEVSYAGDTLPGFYEVDDKSYYIAIDEQELYGNSSVKYEIFNGRKEVVIDNVTPVADGNILSNPATAFTSIRDYFSATLISKDEVTTRLELKSKTADSDSTESIELLISNVSMLPTEIVYKFGDEMVSIKVVKMTPLKSTITSYEASKYADYEIIDFR